MANLESMGRLACPLLACVVLHAGCGGDDEEAEVPPPPESPAVTATFERAYSECSSVSIAQLATKYKRQPTREAVSAAVGEAWSRVFGSGAQGEQVGRQGCLEGFEAGS